MAEALVNARRDDWYAVSAGTQPTGQVNPWALRALTEIGIDPAQLRSKHVEEFIGSGFDLVITVCDDANENCPFWLGQGKRVHIGFPDPAKVTGTDDEKMAAFRAVRDHINQQIVVRLDDLIQ
jgi:arsenate reductase